MTRNVAQRAVVQDLFVKARNKCSIVLYCKIQIRINLACNVTANHYAAISNDPLYIEPLSVIQLKQRRNWSRSNRSSTFWITSTAPLKDGTRYQRGFYGYLPQYRPTH